MWNIGMYWARFASTEVFGHFQKSQRSSKGLVLMLIAISIRIFHKNQQFHRKMASSAELYDNSHNPSRVKKNNTIIMTLLV